MEDHSSPPTEQSESSRLARFIPVGVIAGISLAIAGAVGGTVWYMTRSLSPDVHAPSAPSQTAVQSPTSAASPTDISQVPIEQSVDIYWLKSSGNALQVTPVATPIKAAGQPQAILQAAFEQMLKGTSDPNLASTIPKGTTLRKLEVKSDGIHVDLSKEFAAGGGSASMTGRVAQVIYTATTLDPTAKVWIAVAGKPLTVLGGEGLMIDQPMTRGSFKQNFSL